MFSLSKKMKKINFTSIHKFLLGVLQQSWTAIYTKVIAVALLLTIEELEVEDYSYDAVLGLNILHLLENKEEVIAKVYKMLKPGGIFVTSTVCLEDTMKWFKIIAPIGKFFGLMPLVKVFTTKELLDSLIDTGLVIDYHWQPSNSQGVFKGVFIVAKKSK